LPAPINMSDFPGLRLRLSMEPFAATFRTESVYTNTVFL